MIGTRAIMVPAATTRGSDTKVPLQTAHAECKRVVRVISQHD